MTHNKLKLWQSGAPWDEAEATWESAKQEAQKTHPLKTLSSLPRMPGITKGTARGLTLKSIWYLIAHDPRHVFLRYCLKHPVRYALRFIHSALKGKPYKRDGDFFLYGLNSVDAFHTAMSEGDPLLVVGFSYCHKPHECPSGRFSPDCQHALENPVCRQCFIGKTVHALPLQQRSITPLFIPTIHYIGEELFKLKEQHPKRPLLFLITACEMTLEMFGNWGNMIGARGIGVRLDGRICNTMKAFKLSEVGIKPGLTVVLPETEARILDIIKKLWTEPTQ